MFGTAELNEANFNPHSHEGSDATGEEDETNKKDFNPHSHEGSDDKLYLICNPSDISIHTPTKGVTLVVVRTGVVDGISIHTPTKGVTKM